MWFITPLFNLKQQLNIARANPNNFLFLNLRKIIELDPDILKYIGSPAESEFIRISSSEFVVYNDDNKRVEINKVGNVEVSQKW